MLLNKKNNTLYIHMPKTGGTFITSIYMDLFGNDCRLVDREKKAGLYLKQHRRPLDYPDDIKERLNAMKQWGTIRDPWSWYLSWYFYVKDRIDNHNKRKMFEIYGGSKNAIFKEVLWGLTHQNKVEYTKRRHNLFHPKPSIEKDVGLFSVFCYYYFGAMDRDKMTLDFLVDMRQMERGLQDVLELSESEIFSYKKENESKYKKEPIEYYDQEMIDWVFHSDNLLINQFNMKPFKQLPNYRVDLKWNGLNRSTKKSMKGLKKR